MSVIKGCYLISYSDEHKYVMYKHTEAHNEDDIDIISRFNPVFSTYPIAKPGSLLKYPLFYVENSSNGTYMIICSFYNPKDESYPYYSLGVSFDIKYSRAISEYGDIFSENVTGISVYFSSLIKNSIPLLKIKQTLSDFLYLAEKLLKNIPIIPKNEKITGLSRDFLEKLVTSHLSTQMTTVFEAKTVEIALPYIHFLSYFTIPSLLTQCSLDHHSDPIPGLYIQVIVPQKDIPTKKLLLFPRSWTYVNLHDFRIIQSPDYVTHKQIRNTLRNTIFTVYSDSESKRRQSEIMMKYKYRNFDDECNFFHRVLQPESLILSKESCESLFSDLLMEAITCVKIVEAIIKEKQQAFLSPEQVKNVQKILNIDDQKLKILVSIASAFDMKVFSVVYTGCQDVLRKMLNAV